MNAIQFKYDKQHRLKIYIKQLRTIETKISIYENIANNVILTDNIDNLLQKIEILQKNRDLIKMQISRCISPPNLSI